MRICYALSSWCKRIRALLYKIFGLNKDLHILDIGCGTGQYAKEMLDLGVGRMSLIDVSTDMLKAAKRKLANAIEQGRVQCLRTIKAPPLPLYSDCFDVILMTATESEFSGLVQSFQMFPSQHKHRINQLRTDKQNN
ncbi:hypothetical protein MAR_005993 [Mya arenaria]|uniref:Methyltransferase domain-containing protein n=1 Tax=Mya arenaria TaxID=6604 RepID=A0ABY7D784_MYAAR|nr:hypothetical protein MAR_005993 [Mya arenaria]